MENGNPLPDLIIIDGGKGQLSAACDALKQLGLYGKVPIIGIAKRLEEIYFPEDTLPIYIDKKSESLKLIQRCRDEAHRFGITHHRNRRSKNFLISSLESAPGIGKTTATKVLSYFKTIGNIKAASDEELVQVLGKDKARRIREFLENEKVGEDFRHDLGLRRPGCRKCRDDDGPSDRSDGLFNGIRSLR